MRLDTPLVNSWDPYFHFARNATPTQVERKLN